MKSAECPREVSSQNYILTMIESQQCILFRARCVMIRSLSVPSLCNMVSN